MEGKRLRQDEKVGRLGERARGDADFVAFEVRKRIILRCRQSAHSQDNQRDQSMFSDDIHTRNVFE